VLAVSKPDCTLDTLIEEHAKYLNNITHKGLLGSGRSGKEGSLLGQLHEILKVTMSFKEGMVTPTFS
jgi:gamma-tubulin complex component 3